MFRPLLSFLLLLSTPASAMAPFPAVQASELVRRKATVLEIITAGATALLAGYKRVMQSQIDRGLRDDDEVIAITDDGLSLRLTLRVASTFDQLRVLVAAE